jgi:hypothetical protein
MNVELSAPKPTAPCTQAFELFNDIDLFLVAAAVPKGQKRKPSAKATSKNTRACKLKSLYQGYEVVGCGEARDIPWATLHVAYDAVQLKPPKPTADATVVEMKRGNVVQIKSRGDQEFAILWLQSRNMQPTGWECAIAAGADRFIVSLSEIVGHAVGTSRDVAADAESFWNAKAGDYLRLQKQDDEQKRKRSEAAHSQSKRRTHTLAQAAPTHRSAPSQHNEEHELEDLRAEIANIQKTTAELQSAVTTLAQTVTKLNTTYENFQAMFHTLLKKTELKTK